MITLEMLIKILDTECASWKIFNGENDYKGEWVNDLTPYLKREVTNLEEDSEQGTFYIVLREG